MSDGPVAIADAAAGYAEYLQSLTVDRLDALESVCASEIRFRDPFHDVCGIEAYRRILADMFAQVADVRFQVTDMATSDETAYLRFTFTGVIRRLRRPITLSGVSEVGFDAVGLVVEHYDHYDAASQFYEVLPGIGTVLRLIRRRIAAG